MSLRAQITEDMKTAMRAKDAGKLGTVRLILADIKRKEVDERIEVSDEQVLQIIEKMIKQRKDSITQFEAGNRADLADIEKAELAVLTVYMPAGLSEADIGAAVAEAITASGASGAQDMGKVMAMIKPAMPKGTDMGLVSAMIKRALSAA